MSDADTFAARVAARVARLYDAPSVEPCTQRIVALVDAWRERTEQRRQPGLSERDAVLITYGDQLSAPDETPLAVLGRFLRTQRLDQCLSTVHLLPFFPYSSDDGFAVQDYRQVDPALGSWEDVAALGPEFRLMFDLVLNHVSASHEWFRSYQEGDPAHARFFIERDPGEDLSAVVRPRTAPLLSPFDTAQGRRHLWTTFSADQIDLDFSEPAVLVEMLDVLAEYITRGARIVRLDAVAFLWKTRGTSCLHLPETHEVVKLMRDVAEALVPGTLILTETNVPHAQNVSYFGAGDEAHMVYQFSLPPLLLDAVVQRDPQPLVDWLEALAPAPPGTAYFNFTASHDGVGVRPLEGLVPESRIAALADAVRARGGAVSERSKPDGSTAPYELNIAYVSAVGEPDGLAPAEHVKRFLATQAFALALRGVPAVYFHSLVGSESDLEGARSSGQPRRINRRKLALAALEADLASRGTLRRRVLQGYRRLLRVRRGLTAFHPAAPQRALTPPVAGVVGFERGAAHGESRVLVLANFGPAPARFSAEAVAPGPWVLDLIANRRRAPGTVMELAPFQVVWLQSQGLGFDS